MIQSNVNEKEIKLEVVRNYVKVESTLFELTKKYPNDTELGSIVRKLINTINE